MSVHIPHIPHPHIPKPHGFLPHILDQYIHSKWAHYVTQCGLASLSLVLILIVGDTLLKAAIVVGVASSAFTIFVIPESVAATPRKVIGGHLVAALIGAGISYLLQTPGLEIYVLETRYILEISAAISVGIGIFFMVVTNTEHPPAAGTAFGLVIHPFSLSAIVFIISSVIILSVIKHTLRSKLIDLV